MSIQGKWGDSEITINQEKQVTVTMGARPNGTGVQLCANPDVILVNFPDDKMYVGTLVNEKELQWCRLGQLWTNNVWKR